MCKSNLRETSCLLYLNSAKASLPYQIQISLIKGLAYQPFPQSIVSYKQRDGKYQKKFKIVVLENCVENSGKGKQKNSTKGRCTLNTRIRQSM